MRIVYKDFFISRFEKQLEYIKHHSPKSAKQLKLEIIQRIQDIA